MRMMPARHSSGLASQVSTAPLRIASIDSSKFSLISASVPSDFPNHFGIHSSDSFPFGQDAYSSSNLRKHFGVVICAIKTLQYLEQHRQHKVYKLDRGARKPTSISIRHQRGHRCPLSLRVQLLSDCDHGWVSDGNENMEACSSRGRKAVRAKDSSESIRKSVPLCPSGSLPVYRRNNRQAQSNSVSTAATRA